MPCVCSSAFKICIDLLTYEIYTFIDLYLKKLHAISVCFVSSTVMTIVY